MSLTMKESKHPFLRLIGMSKKETEKSNATIKQKLLCFGSIVLWRR
jgi:hypothetical protein